MFKILEVLVIIRDFSDYEIPKYRKKKQKKTVKKSNHKHDYSKEVLIKRKMRQGNYRYNYAKVCSICGKIGEENYFESKKVDGSNYDRLLSQEEILEKHKDLPIIEKNNRGQ